MALMEDVSDVRVLADVAPGTRVRIHEILAGRQMAKRLADLGLPLGSEAEVITRRGGGAIVVQRNGMNIALGAGMARKIMVGFLAPASRGGGTD